MQSQPVALGEFPRDIRCDASGSTSADPHASTGNWFAWRAGDCLTKRTYNKSLSILPGDFDIVARSRQLTPNRLHDGTAGFASGSVNQFDRKPAKACDPALNDDRFQ